MQLLDGCSFLEELLGVEGCLQRIKEGSSSSREIKKELIDLDFSSLLEESKTHSSTSVAAEIAESTSWLKIWDLALDYGPRGTSAIQALFSTMTRTMCGSAPCGFCEDSVTTTYLDHFLLCHLPTNCPGMSKEDIIEGFHISIIQLTRMTGNQWATPIGWQKAGKVELDFEWVEL